MAKKKTYSKSFLADVERFNKQRARMAKIENAYKSHSDQYYARNKRRNLLANSYDRTKNINPLSLTPSQLRNQIKENAAVIKELGVNSAMSGDLAEALVLVELNNEAYENVNFADSETEEIEDWELKIEQDRVFSQMLFDNLKGLRLTPYQFKKALDRSILPWDAKAELVSDYKEYKSKQRK